LRDVLLAIVASAALFAGQRGPAQQKSTPSITVIDANGKEIPLKSWRFTGGTLRLPAIDTASDKNTGPECLAFREDKSTTFQDGILTLVPVSSIRAIDYDNAKRTVAVTLLDANGKEQVLRGSTKFRDINKLTVEAEADLGELGVAAVKYHGGASATEGIRGLRFAKAMPAPKRPATRAAAIVAVDKEKHTVLDPIPLYRLADGTLRTAPTLFFKTTVKIDVAKISRLKQVAATRKRRLNSRSRWKTAPCTR